MTWSSKRRQEYTQPRAAQVAMGRGGGDSEMAAIGTRIGNKYYWLDSTVMLFLTATSAKALLWGEMWKKHLGLPIFVPTHRSICQQVFNYSFVAIIVGIPRVTPLLNAGNAPYLI